MAEEPQDEHNSQDMNAQLTVEVFLQRLYRDPRYMLIGKTEHFGRELITYVEGCTVLSATGDVKGQLLLNSEFELQGRPDGERPYGQRSLVDHYLEQRGQSLDPSEDELSALRDESWEYYVRRNFAFLLGDYLLAQEDAEHNLSLAGLIERSEAAEGVKWSFLKWWPWIERDRAIAEALWNVEQGRLEQAAAGLYRAQRAIGQFGERHAEGYAREEGDGPALATHMRQHLQALVEALRREKHLLVSLEERLDQAEASGDAQEVERLRAEMIREAMEGE